MDATSTSRTTHNLAATLQNISARLLHKASTISSDIEYGGVTGGQNKGESPAPAPSAANDILNRSLDNLLALENMLDRIHESVGSTESMQKQQAMDECSTASAPVLRGVSAQKQSARNF